eukprot:2835971-Rhodomonas_salina.2
MRMGKRGNTATRTTAGGGGAMHRRVNPEAPPRSKRRAPAFGNRTRCTAPVDGGVLLAWAKHTEGDTCVSSEEGEDERERERERARESERERQRKRGRE